MLVCFVCGEDLAEDGIEVAPVRVKLDTGWDTRFIHSPRIKAQCWTEYAHWRNAQLSEELKAAKRRTTV